MMNIIEIDQDRRVDRGQGQAVGAGAGAGVIDLGRRITETSKM